MTTLAARGSGTPATTGTTWATVTNAVDGAAGTNPATYTTYTNAAASAVATIEITGYGFSSSIASTDTLNSVTVSLRHFENNTGRFASVRFQAFDGATAIGSQTTCTLATAARNDVATPAVTLAQLRSSTFKIVVTITGAASTQSRVESIDYVDVTADYTIAPPAVTQAAYRFYNDGTETGSTAYTTTATLAVSYAETNGDTQASIGVTGLDTVNGQSFLGNGALLARTGFYVRRVGSPVGNLTAVLYAHTGTFGTTGTGTGSVLATSTTSTDASTLSTSYQWVEFDFDGSYTLTNGSAYVIGISATSLGSASNCVDVRMDQTSPTHAGNRSMLGSGGWAGSSADLIFRVYTGAYTADTSSGDVNLQVRTRLQSTTAVAVPATDDWQLQWEKNTSGTWTDVGGPEMLTEEYADTNHSANQAIGLPTLETSVAQSFLGNGKRLSRVGFYLSRSVNVPVGNLTATLYAHTGTFGTSSAPTGTALATSTTTVDAATVPETPSTWFYFDFDKTYTLANGTPYCIAISIPTQAASTSIRVGVDSTSGTHPGSTATFVTVWTAAGGTRDFIFRVYTASSVTPATTVLYHASANLTDGSATTNRLGAGTGSFVAGKVSEDGLVDDLGWTANNYTEVLYSVTLKQADLTPTDTVKFRVLRNGATTGLTYTQVPTITIGTAGPTDRTGTATGQLAVGGSAAGAKNVTGTATGTLAIVGSAAGSVAAVPVLGTATGSLTIAGVASGVPGVVATATGALAVAGVASGVAGVTGVAVGSLTVAGVAAGIPGVTATATGSLTLTGAASGSVTKNVVGTATGALTLSGTALGVPGVTGVAAGSLIIGGTATGQKTTTGTATGTLSIVGTATAVKTVAATATGALTITGTATATKQVTGAATGQIAITSQALGLVEGNAVGTATGSLTVVGLAVGRRGTTAVATGTIAITGLATGRRAVTATVTGSVTITGTATGATVVVAVHTVNVWNGTAFIDAPVKTWNGTAWVDATAVKTWNGSTFVDAI